MLNHNFLIKSNSLYRVSTSPLYSKVNHRNIINHKTINHKIIHHDKKLNANFSTLSNKIHTSESISDKIYRYLDITGFLTRYNNRKMWILDLDSYSRLSTPLITEYERKMVMFMGFHATLFFTIAMYFAMKAHQHAAIKPVCPKLNEYPGVDGRKKDFTWHGRLFLINPKERCKECRWLELECKKECFERLKAEGHKFILNGGNPLSIPRDTLHDIHH